MSDLKPATLDANAWYHITEEAVDQDYDSDFQSMLQPNQDNGNDKSLHVWPAKTKTKALTVYWQFQPIGDKPGRYAIRCSQTTIQKQLSVCYLPDEKVENTRTRPCLEDSSAGDEQHWDVADWGVNDMYRLINVKNGSDYHLDCYPNGPVYMSPNTEPEPYQSRQHWLMTSVKAEITSTTGAAEASSSASNSDSSTDAESSTDRGLSPGTIAGISIGSILGVIALALIAFSLWRRKKRNSQPTKATEHSGYHNEGHDAPMVVSTVPPHDSAYDKQKGPAPHIVHEASPEHAPAELSAEQRHEMG
ncbi:hypothetical protein FZEAL_9875 [Fusarium zealandicum]|uniref:Uncharacterized protein n=1 Tax=Fusarium zealandicum TaxID=1053134 RepID=A0A8H4U7Q7_9HYPO|nr:hypothetical protein FZEAL_9875 [Fusarium zealandicum]